MIRLSKRGQEGTSTTTIIGWVIGIILLVVVGTIIYKFSQQSSDITKLIPDEFQKAATYCKNSPFSSDKAQYCSDFKEFDYSNTVYYYTCDEILKKVDPSATVAFDCSGSGAANYCSLLKQQEKFSTGKSVKISESDCDTSVGQLA